LTICSIELAGKARTPGADAGFATVHARNRPRRDERGILGAATAAIKATSAEASAELAGLPAAAAPGPAGRIGLLSSPSMSATRRLLPRVALALGTGLVLLVAAELALGWLGLVPDPREFVLRRMTPAFQQDAQGRYTTHPRRAYSTAPGFRWSPRHLGRDATGAWPYRGRPPVPRPPDDRTLRVALIGDSCIYGASLDGCDAPAWQLQRALDRRGLPPDEVLVCAWGVPGYSTVQMHDLLVEALDEFAPDVVVLYPAAWNDQAPALRRGDAELLAELHSPGLLDRLRLNTRVGAALLHLRDRAPREEIVAAWRRGAPLFGERVPEAQLPGRLLALIETARGGGGSGSPAVVVLAPAHPPATRRDHPRTARDAAAVLAAATSAGVVALDGQTILLESDAELAQSFSDYVHPSPTGAARLAEAVAVPVAAELERRRATRRPIEAARSPSVRALHPTVAPVLGDTRVTVELAGWSADEPLPVLVIGGVPLLELQALDDSTLTGVLMANGPGPHDLVVQGPRGMTRVRDALRLVEPELQLQLPASAAQASAAEAETGAVLQVRSRPGDRLRLTLSAERLEPPQWNARGAQRLGGTPRLLHEGLLCDENGLATLRLAAVPQETLWIQALVAPDGALPGPGLTARFCLPVALPPLRP